MTSDTVVSCPICGQLTPPARVGVPKGFCSKLCYKTMVAVMASVEAIYHKRSPHAEAVEEEAW